MSSEQTNRRPVLVWIISIFYLVSVGLTLSSLVLVLMGAIPMNPGQQAYFDSQPMLDVVLTIVVGLGHLAGVVFLFLLRRPALYCFAGSFAVSLLMTLYHMAFRDWLATAGTPGMIGTAVGWSINIAIILYVWHLTRKRVLI